jgi:GntR family transcriptional regulator/MocR family aminotransferase
VSRVSSAIEQRRTALRDALNHYLHKFVVIRAPAGTSGYWVRTVSNLDARALARTAASVGVLVEPTNEFGHPRAFCMGVASLPGNRIREGVVRLSRLLRQDPNMASPEMHIETDQALRGSALRRAMAGKTLLYNTVYGDPCTIHVGADGHLTGRAGYANEDCDTGRWWIEGDRWYRQWRSWVYGEAVGFYTVIEGDQVRWYKEDGQFADTAVIVRKVRHTRDSVTP